MVNYKIQIRKLTTLVDSRLLLIFFILFIFILPLLTSFYISHDGEAHVARFASYFQAFTDGQFPPRWAGNLNFGYGSPIFIFYYPLPGYIASLIHLFGVSFEDTFKIIIFFSFIFSSISFFLWAKLLFRKNVALTGALLYGLAPYHFLNLYIRGDVAETLAFAIVPLVFLFLEKTFRKPTTMNILLGGVFYGLLIISHNGVSLMFSPVLLFYILLKKNLKYFFDGFSILIFGLLISMFFWFPAIYEGKYINTALFVGNLYKEHFPTINQLFYSDFGFGPDVRIKGGLSPQIGILYWVLAVLSLLLFSKYKNKLFFLGWILIFASSIFITLPISDFVWRSFYLLRLFEFPWRFVGLASFSASILACFFLEKANKKIILIVLITLFLSSFMFVKINEKVSKTDEFYKNYSGTTYFHGEASSIWTAGDFYEYPKSKIDLIGGKAYILDTKIKSNVHSFRINVETNEAQILDNTVYFPGWEAVVDDKTNPIEFQDINHRGLITFRIPKGEHSIKVIFRETSVRNISNLISIFTLFIVFSYLIIVYNRGRKRESLKRTYFK